MILSAVLGGQLALRGRFVYRAADGSVIKEVEIIDGALPAVAAPSTLPALPEPPHVHRA